MVKDKISICFKRYFTLEYHYLLLFTTTYNLLLLYYITTYPYYNFPEYIHVIKMKMTVKL